MNWINVKFKMPKKIHWTESATKQVRVKSKNGCFVGQYDYDAERWRDRNLYYRDNVVAWKELPYWVED